MVECIDLEQINEVFRNEKKRNELFKRSNEEENVIIEVFRNEKKRNELFKHLNEEEKVIKIPNEQKNRMYYFLFGLDILITSQTEAINFIFSPDLIINNNEIKVDYSENNVNKIIKIKINIDLIDNYHAAKKNLSYLDSDYFKSEYNDSEIEKIKKELEDYYKNYLFINEDLKKKYNLKEIIYNINIKTILSLRILAFLEDPNKQNFDDIYYILKSLEPDTYYIDQVTISKIKTMIKEEQFQNKYMIKDLESITIEKIYILYVLVFLFANKYSNINIFPFLLTTKNNLEKIFPNKICDQLSPNPDDEKRKLLEKIIENLSENEQFYSTTLDTSFREGFIRGISIIEKFRKKRMQREKQNFLKILKIDYSKYTRYKVVSHRENSYCINSIKLLESIIKPSMNEENSYNYTNNSEYLFDCYHYDNLNKILNENNKNISIVINDELNKKDIKRAIKDFSDMQKDFSKRIDVKAKIDKNNGKVIISLRSSEIVYLFSFKIPKEYLKEIVDVFSKNEIGFVWFE